MSHSTILFKKIVRFEEGIGINFSPAGISDKYVGLVN
jgi:hypothetical protein